VNIRTAFMQYDDIQWLWKSLINPNSCFVVRVSLQFAFIRCVIKRSCTHHHAICMEMD